MPDWIEISQWLHLKARNFRVEMSKGYWVWAVNGRVTIMCDRHRGKLSKHEVLSQGLLNLICVIARMLRVSLQPLLNGVPATLRMFAVFIKILLAQTLNDVQ